MQLSSLSFIARRPVAATLVASLLAALPLVGQAEPSFTVLHSFSADGSTKSGGAAPASGLVQAPNGVFYGVTPQGGKYGLGALYAMTPSGRVRTLVSFNENTGTAPKGPLTLASDGNLYGVASAGGNCADCGTVFRLKSDGRFKVIHRLDKNTEGSSPNGGLLEASDGNLYGTAATGGPNFFGTIFRMTPAGEISMYLAFNPRSTGPAEPRSGLIQAADGRMYGTTRGGGWGTSGTIYWPDDAGSANSVYSFEMSDGGAPTSGVVEGRDGMLYGTTPWWGPTWPAAYGTVYRVSKDGNYQRLASMGGELGETPYAGLLLASDGYFYGVNSRGGANGVGTVFRMTPDGVMSLVHTFNGSDGANPTATLIQGADGALYGTAAGGGAFGAGTAFRIVP